MPHPIFPRPAAPELARCAKHDSTHTTDARTIPAAAGA